MKQAAAAALTAMLCTPYVAHASCSDLLPPAAPTGRGGGEFRMRPLQARDILMLRDIGQPDGSVFSAPTPLAVSSDGRNAAFVINRADPENNGYCRGLVVIELDGRGTPRLIDRGGELITSSGALRGLVSPSGWPAVVTPVWSSDGEWIAYLRRDGGRTQVWRVRADGGGAHPVTSSKVDVEAVAWSRETGRIVFTARPGLRSQADDMKREGLSGWLYDDRFIPNLANAPLPADVPAVVFSIGPDGSALRKANAPERTLIASTEDGFSGPSASAADGRKAVTRRDGPIEPLILSVTDHGREIRCDDAACRGAITGLWWDGQGDDLIFLRRDGWGAGEMGLYRWDPRSGRPPRRILTTSDVLLGCVPRGSGAVSALICTLESARQPRQLVRVDTRTGRVQVIYDPNPEFAGLALGKVERLRWTNALGLKAWADLVLPPGYQGHAKLPMVVVQYHSSGFLRGGTGDEYPIHALAAAGFAVLSVERDVLNPSVFPGIRTWPQLNARLLRDWAQRRGLLNSLEKVVGMVVARGIADPRRIGITGLSDGSSSARFALINSKLFSVAAISTCCMEEQAVTTYSGIRLAEDFAQQGYPRAGSQADEESRAFWKAYSFSVNAERIDQPILMQLADDEYLLALQSFTALRAAGKPVEMYVYPGEHHIKWQSAHRAAVYERNLDWFAFWLQGRIDPDLSKREQYRRWQALRGVAPSSGST